MHVVDLKTYLAAEKEAMHRLPNRVMEAFVPFAFQKLGYPSGVSQEDEIWKFADAMQEGRHNATFASHFPNGLTEQEFSIYKKLLTETKKLLPSLGRPDVPLPINAALRSLHFYNNILALIGDNKPRIFELGAGSGYLGALLLLENIPYISSDVTQGFYLFQSRLFHHFAPKSLDLAHPDAETKLKKQSWENLQKDHLSIHIPWWKFASLRPPEIPQCDLITCNHMLGEMHVYALYFFLKIAQFILKDSEKGYIVFENWGAPVGSSYATIQHLFYQSGWAMVHNDEFCTCFAQKEKLKSGETYFQYSGNGHEPLPFSSSKNPASSSILKMREQRKTQIKKTLLDIDAFYRELGMNSSFAPETDAEFLKFIGLTL